MVDFTPPVLKKKPAEQTVSREDTVAAKLSGKTVVIVNDSRERAEEIKRVFLTAQPRCAVQIVIHMAQNPMELAQVVMMHNPDMVVVDGALAKLPGSTVSIKGADVCRQLSAQGYSNRLMGLTGDVEFFEKNLMQAGATVVKLDAHLKALTDHLTEPL